MSGHPSSHLRLRSLGKTFASSGGRRVVALRDVDLEVSPGEVIALVGPSGCGKSTLLRIVAGLERGDEGTVSVDGKHVSGPGPDRGMVFQEHRLMPWLTVAENVAFGLEPATDRVRVIVQTELDRVGLSGFEQAYPRELSGGMAQRAALARALAPNPGVLLLDEPFGALDAFTKVRLQDELLRSWSAHQSTMLVVTHDIEEAIFLGDRVVVMSERPGTIQRIFEVSLPRPRERTASAFTALRRDILREFESADCPAPGAPRSGDREKRLHAFS